MLRDRTRLIASGGRATLASPIDAIIERRSDGGFSPILEDGLVRPGEPIRLVADDMAGFGGAAEFTIKDSAGRELFKATASRRLFGDTAWVDTVAPTVEGSYTLEVAQSVWLRVHRDTLRFGVSRSAPTPPPPPPDRDGLLGDVKWIVIVIAVALLASKLIPQRKA